MSDEFDEVYPRWCMDVGSWRVDSRLPWLIYRDDYDDIVEVPCPE